MDPDLVVRHRGVMPEYCFNFLSDIPTVFHSHHFNLFWDQTIDDALGPKLSTALRANAAGESFYDILAGLALDLAVSTPDDMLELAQATFAAAGQGRLTFEVDERGGRVLGEHLHFSTAYNEKYRRVRRRHGLDALAAGFSAAAIELAHGLQRDSVRCRELACAAIDAPRCEFKAEVGVPGPMTGPMTRTQFDDANGGPAPGLFQAEADAIVDGLGALVRTLAGDTRGLIRAFGVYMSELPTTYYNRAGYDGLRHVRRTAPELVPVMHTLMREAGHACVFHTFGSILTSPEWNLVAPAPTGEPELTLASSMAIARVLGLGYWTVREYVAGARLVITTPATYEAAYFVNREGRASSPQCFFFQGAVVGLMQLVERVDWPSRPTFDRAEYERLFRPGLPWRAEETTCVAQGDPCCEVVVTRDEGYRKFV